MIFRVLTVDWIFIGQFCHSICNSVIVEVIGAADAGGHQWFIEGLNEINPTWHTSRAITLKTIRTSYYKSIVKKELQP